MIGPNGAGKTTVFNLITGVYQPTGGSISFNGQSLVGRKPYQITATASPAHSKTSAFFRRFTVFDNVRVGVSFAPARRSSATRSGADARFCARKRKSTASVMEMLEIFHLGKFRDALAKSLRYGDQRRLEIVRALATRPKLLLLDEPAAGMNPNEKGRADEA